MWLMFQTLAQLNFLIETPLIGLSLAGTYGYVALGNIFNFLINVEHREHMSTMA